jgi:hypothetical protein
MSAVKCRVDIPGVVTSLFLEEKKAIKKAKEVAGSKVFQGGVKIYTSSKADEEAFRASQQRQGGAR